MATITQGGITVTISGSPDTGTWRVNGHYIVGACTITGWTPTPTGSGATRRHGAMLNPASLTQQGFDGRMDNSGFEQEYSAVLDASLSLPISLSPGDCLVVSASGNLSSADLDAEGGNAQMLDEIMVIHCVASAPASTDFRPPYAGTDRTGFSTSDIVGTLPNHAAPFDPVGTGVFDFDMDDPTWLTRPHYHLRMAAERPQNRMAPRAQQEYYPAYRARVVNALAALSVTDHARKLEARDRVIQDGIDIWGCIKASMSAGKNGIFTSGAGYGGGYYFPLLYAGYMLGNAEMLSYLDLKWTNHGGYWHYDTDFDGSHPCTDGDGNPIDYTGESVGAFWETTSVYNSPTAWSGYALPRSRDAYTEGFPLYGDARNDGTEGGGPSTNDSQKNIAKVYHAVACDTTGYTTPLTGSAGWGDYMLTGSMYSCAGGFLVARLMGIEGYYKNATREMVYWWFSDSDLWNQTHVGAGYLEDINVYGGTGNTFLRSLWASHGSMGAYIADGAPPDPDPLPAVQTATLTISVTV